MMIILLLCLEDKDSTFYLYILALIVNAVGERGVDL